MNLWHGGRGVRLLFLRCGRRWIVAGRTGLKKKTLCCLLVCSVLGNRWLGGLFWGVVGVDFVFVDSGNNVLAVSEVRTAIKNSGKRSHGVKIGIANRGFLGMITGVRVVV